MNKRMNFVVDEGENDLLAAHPVRTSRPRRTAKIGAEHEHSRRKQFSRGRRKIATVGGIHLRRNKRTYR
jgi:hypothetical protein